MNKKEILKLILVGVMAALIALIGTGSGLFYLLKYRPQVLTKAYNTLIGQPQTSPAVTADQNQTEVISTHEKAVVAAVKKANSAVVAITVSKNVPVYEQYYENVPSPFGDFFGSDFQVSQLRQNGTQLQEIGGGSGFLVSDDGYIVTNRHVVADEKAEYTVFTNDGKKYDAKVIARDSVLDLAVIKIEGSGFPHLSFGNSDKLEVGQTVIAIGNALAEFRNTVSVGVVSGLSRSIQATDQQGGTEALDQLIQTDAGINPGNSGGPLLNLAGEVIGINVATTDGAENISFALSANNVKDIVDSVKQTGRIVRPFLGIRYIPITEDLKKRNNLSIDYGALVQRGTAVGDLAVVPGSPADKAGIVENDIILEVDGTKLTSDKDLANIIRTKKIGDTVKLKVMSKGQEKIVNVVLEEVKS